MAKFEVVFTVNTHDTDKNGNLYPSTALRYLHEAANIQLDSTHPTMDELRYEQKKAFILSRASMTFDRPLHKHETVVASTWASGGKAATFYRSGELLVNGEVVGRLVSLWALVDLETRRLCRVRDTVLGVESLEEYPLEIPSHVRFPEGLLFEEAGKRRVYNSDIDLNGHINNTNYPDMFCDFIENIENLTVKSFVIGYIHEARLHEELTVYRASEGNTHYLYTTRADGTRNAEAIITTGNAV